MRDTTIYRIMKTSLSFVGDGDNSFTSIMDWNVKQELRDVACSKHLVNSCKSCCSLLRWEVRCEYTIWCTLPPQELACTTWWTCSCSRTVTGRCHRWNKQKVMIFMFFCTKRKKGSILFMFPFSFFFGRDDEKIERSDDFRIGIVGDVHERTRKWWWRKKKKKWNDGEVFGVFEWIL